MGRVLTVNIAKPMTNKLGSHKAIWAEGDDFYNNRLREDGTETLVDADIKDGGK
jgi:hypothetical protein